MNENKKLEKAYKDIRPSAQRFSTEILKQIKQLFENENISLSFPIQHRVKTWASITEKLKRKTLTLSNIKDLSDLVGLRIILEFKRDVDKVCDLISSHFTVIERQDAFDKLREDQFGYSSTHFIIEVPESWLALPTLTNMRGLRAEIQVRTTAQHIWASASHTLQYKKESAIPPSVRRSINRVSALLETVDLEFERVLKDRETYLLDSKSSSPSEKLNVDLIEKILDSLLPSRNKTDDEFYGELLDELKSQRIYTQKQLTELIKKNLDKILVEDSKRVNEIIHDPYASEFDPENLERAKRGYFYSHVGLIRVGLAKGFGNP